MRKQAFIGAFIALGCSLIVTACSNDDNVENGTSNEARFTAIINEATITRAYDTSWESTDQIGISGKSGNKEYTNVGYKVSNAANGEFTPIDVNNPIYYQSTAQVNFTAYYPYDGTNYPTLTADTKNQANQKQFDFLYGFGTGSTTQTAALTFDHMMSKIVFTVVAGEDVTLTDIQNAGLSLGNIVHVGSFDASTGSTALTGSAESYTFQGSNLADGTSAAPYSENTSGGSRTYTLILFPQTFTSNSKVTFQAVVTQSGTTSVTQTFSTEIDFSKATPTSGGDAQGTNELKAKTQYNVTITLNKTGVTVVNCSINRWTTYNLSGSATM